MTLPDAAGKPSQARAWAGPAAFALLAGLMLLGASRTGPLPALGPLLDPVDGLWSVARQTGHPAPEVAAIPDLEGEVEVVIDARGVPHIYADTVADAVRALGYMQAVDRLFQLELQMRATAGRLTELVGRAALPLDRQQRHLGLAWSAERAWQELVAEDGRDRSLYEALAQGINARIDSLGSDGLPFEYHFLGRRPARWEPVNSLLVGKRMAYTLSYSAEDLWRLRAEGLVGRAAADALYPVHSPVQQPVQPHGSVMPRRLPHTLPPPQPRDASLLRRAEQMLAAVPVPEAVPRGTVVGSNNWAVAAGRAAGNGALLAGDPHLNLTLPSIWYEVHLVVPGRLNVHGVTIPGVPGVLIGFTPRVAWSVTNNYADVIDFYQEQLDDAGQPTAYLLDGEWQPLERREELYFGPDGREIERETLFFTHRGPLRRSAAGDLSMRWLALEERASPSLFLAAAAARDVESLLATFSGFTSPAQNFAMADADGRVAIISAGRYPIRPAVDAGDDASRAPPVSGGDGRRIRDGTRRSSDWTGFWPVSRYPQALDPAQGYVASANQEPVDPRDESAYLGSNWPSPWRALRLNALLRSDDDVTVADMADWQTDPGNAKAALLAPAFVAAAAQDDTLAEAGALLAAWDYRYEADAPAPLLFEDAFERLQAMLWDELAFDESAAAGLPEPPRPREVIVLSLLDEPRSPWWDDQRTPEREDRDALLRRALGDAWDALSAAHGPPGQGTWAWARHRRANIHHLARFPGLGRLELAVAGGGPGNLNPSAGRGTHGASWRMVVALDPDTGARAWGTYPGGQSGNPADPRYDEGLEPWQAGELAPMPSPARADQALELPGATRLHLVPASEAR